jgi:drug/metabolite transporter (DMT)-like permease
VSATDWANLLGVATGLGALVVWAVGGGSWPAQLLAQPGAAWGLAVCVATGLGSGWLASILWNRASQYLSASLCGQLIVSETLFSLLYSFAWDAIWPTPLQWAACALFVMGISASIRAHR